MKKNIVKFLFFLYMLSLLNIISCAPKRAHYDAFLPEPKSAIAPVQKNKDKEGYKLYKQNLKKLRKEWNLYKSIRKNLAQKNFGIVQTQTELFKKYHSEESKKINYEEYFNGVIYYEAYSKALQYKFEEIADILDKIPENSVFYNKALTIMNNLMSDSDGDGYSDLWEIIEGYKPMNPYSHP